MTKKKPKPKTKPEKPKVETKLHMPTKERLERSGGHYEQGDNGTVVMREAPLERLRKSGEITEDQYQAGYRFRDIWHAAGLEAHFGSNDLNRVKGTDGPTYGMAATEGMAIKRDQYRQTVRRLGQGLSIIISDICCHDVMPYRVGQIRLGFNTQSQAKAGAMTAFKIGLDILADEFGIKRRSAA